MEATKGNGKMEGTTDKCGSREINGRKKGSRK